MRHTCASERNERTNVIQQLLYSFLYSFHQTLSDVDSPADPKKPMPAVPQGGYGLRSFDSVTTLPSLKLGLVVALQMYQKTMKLWPAARQSRRYDKGGNTYEDVQNRFATMWPEDIVTHLI